MDKILDAGSNWISTGESSQPKGTGYMDFANQFVDIGQILVAIGVVTLLIVGAIMAIRWITATPDKQAVLKQQLIGLVISAVVIFGAIGIWNLVVGIMKNVEDELESSNSQKPAVVTTSDTTIPQTKTETAKPAK